MVYMASPAHLFHRVTVGLVFCGVLCSAVAAPGLAGDFPTPWRRDANPELIRTLAKNGVKGCGDFAWKSRPSQSSEYLVYCTRDGRTWSAWLAWTAAEKVMGPYAPDPGVPPP
jgi:hypothetical protein